MADQVTSINDALAEQIRDFKDAHPDIEKTLQLFNVSYDQYAATIAAQQSVTTYVMTHTLMPGEQV